MVSFLYPLLRQLVNKSVTNARNFNRNAIDDFGAILESFRRSNRGPIKYARRFSLFSRAINGLYIFRRAVCSYSKLNGAKALYTTRCSVIRILGSHFYNWQILTVTGKACADIHRYLRIKGGGGHIQPIEICIGCIELRLRNFRWRRFRLLRLVRLSFLITSFNFCFWQLNISDFGFGNFFHLTQIFVYQRVHQKQEQKGSYYP